MATPHLTLLSLAATLSALSAQSFVVVPAAYTNIDALSYEWIAGATDPQRQQTLIGPSHLQGLLGQTIEAIEFRRTAVVEAYAAGQMDLTVTLSTSPSTALAPSNQFAANVGFDALQVFQGTVNLPASPATGPRQTPVAWTSNNIVRVAFTTPFVYTGGTLCIDITGAPIAGQQTWWMADAVEEVIAGTQVVEVSGGCGIYGGPQHRWSEAHARSLVPGGVGVFRAQGTPNGIGFAMFGVPAVTPIPLGLLGLPSPGCTLGLDPAGGAVLMPAWFEPEVHPDLAGLATAEVLLPVPASAMMFGLQMATQWLDLAQLATSNTLHWTIGGAVPALDMALVEGHPLDDKGNVTNYLAHVLRLQVQ
jgi:hypothetical protein